MFPRRLRSMNEMASKIKLAHTMNENKEVVSIGVVSGFSILMGMRRDNGRWTLPGGHISLGEDEHTAALRELYEETGIKATTLERLGQEDIVSPTGNKIKVTVFKLETYERQPITLLDPDQEVDQWLWVDFRKGIPAHIASNLHSPKNLTLKLLGLQRW